MLLLDFAQGQISNKTIQNTESVLEIKTHFFSANDLRSFTKHSIQTVQKEKNTE